MINILLRLIGIIMVFIMIAMITFCTVELTDRSDNYTNIYGEKIERPWRK